MTKAPNRATAPRRNPWLWRLPIAIGATLAMIAFGELSWYGLTLAGGMCVMGCFFLQGYGILLDRDEARATGADGRMIAPLTLVLLAMGAVAGWWCADVRQLANFGGYHVECLTMLAFFFPCLMVGLAGGGGSCPAAFWPTLAHGLGMTVVCSTTDFFRRGSWFDDLYQLFASVSFAFACAAAGVHALLRRRGWARFRLWPLFTAAGVWIVMLVVLDRVLRSRWMG